MRVGGTVEVTRAAWVTAHTYVEAEVPDNASHDDILEALGAVAREKADDLEWAYDPTEDSGPINAIAVNGLFPIP